MKTLHIGHSCDIKLAVFFQPLLRDGFLPKLLSCQKLLYQPFWVILPKP